MLPKKHAIRLLKKFARFIKPKNKKRGRTPLYSKEVIVKPLKKIWYNIGFPSCYPYDGRLLKGAPLWLSCNF
jgi:hypothetical protein